MSEFINTCGQHWVIVIMMMIGLTVLISITLEGIAECIHGLPKTCNCKCCEGDEDEDETTD